jgi:hypothetical protein
MLKQPELRSQSLRTLQEYSGLLCLRYALPSTKQRQQAYEDSLRSLAGLIQALWTPALNKLLAGVTALTTFLEPIFTGC